MGKYGSIQLQANCSLILLLALSMAVNGPVRQVLLGLLWSNWLMPTSGMAKPMAHEMNLLPQWHI
jgi:hypothetical protein